MDQIRNQFLNFKLSFRFLLQRLMELLDLSRCKKASDGKRKMSANAFLTNRNRTSLRLSLPHSCAAVEAVEAADKQEEEEEEEEEEEASAVALRLVC